MGEAFKDKFAFVGFGMVNGPLLNVTPRTMQVEATQLAMEDAGLKREDIDGPIDLRRAGGGGDRPGWSDAFPRVLGLDFCLLIIGDLTGLSEAVIQLRGETGGRQVKDAEICLVTGHGGEILSPGMCSIHTSLILRR